MYFKGQGKQRKILRRASPDPGNREGRIQTQNGIYSIISPKYIQLYLPNIFNYMSGIDSIRMSHILPGKM